MEANAVKAFRMKIIFNIFPRISLHCKLVAGQYWEYEYGLLWQETCATSFPESLVFWPLDKGNEDPWHEIVVPFQNKENKINQNDFFLSLG